MPSKLKPKPKPIRYRAGKAPAPEAPSSSESEDESTSEKEQAPPKQQAAPPQLQQRTQAPKATSFPKAVPSRPAPTEEIKEEEFETEDEDSGKDESADDDSGSGSEEDSCSEDSSSDSSTGSARRKLLRPIFVKKADRKTDAQPTDAAIAAASYDDADGRARRKAEANELIQEQIDRRAATAAAGQKEWDDDEDMAEADMVDDNDDLDPEYERAAWKLRELQRVRRERAAIEESERALAEIERRRNLSAAEREEEDQAFLEEQRAQREGKGEAGFMKKYHHRGAFFQDTDQAKEFAGRDLMGASYVDEVKDRGALPKYLQVRDETMIGRKGRQRHRDLRSEDTGRWGDTADPRKRADGEWVGDERFRPDFGGGREGGSRTGANAGPLGERKRGGEGDGEREGKRSRVGD